MGLFDRIVIMIGVNSTKAESAQSAEELQARLRQLDGLQRVEVIQWSGLTVDAARNVGAEWLLRGVRSVADFEYERNLADINRRISGLETVILFAEPELSMISSSIVRELNRYGRDTTDLIV